MIFNGLKTKALVLALQIGGLCLCTVDAAAQDVSVKVELVDGSVTGELLSVELDSIELGENGESKKFSFEELSKIEFAAPANAFPEDATAEKNSTEKNAICLLVDGTELNVQQFSIAKRVLSVKLLCGLRLNIDARDIEYVKFQDYENEIELNRQWREILADESREGDAIIVNRSNELDSVEGVVGELAEDKLEFTIGEQTARVPIAKIDAVLFYHARGREFARAISEITLEDQSVLMTRRMKLESDNLVATAVCGTKVAIPVGKLSEINFELGRDAFLSQFTPATNDWQPLIASASLLEQLRKLKVAKANKTSTGQPLSLRFFSEDQVASLGRIQQFENGFSIQGGGRLSFNLNGQYETLTGLVGFNPEASLNGRVMFRVVLDGQAVLEKEMNHRTMKNPLKLDLSIQEVDRIVFQVGYQDGRSTGDQLHLVDLKVSR